MKRSFFSIVLLVLGFSVSIEAAEFSQVLDEKQNYTFELQDSQLLTIINGDEINQGHFDRHTQFIVLQTAIDDEGKEWIRLGVEYTEKNQSVRGPSDVWISLADFLNANIVLIEEIVSEGTDLSMDLSSGEKKINLAGRDYFVARVLRMTYCYRYVKKYLLKVDLVKVYLPGASAYMAANILPKHGFRRTSRGPSKSIKHDVCVYRGGPSGHGHIEIMTTKGWYYGYGYKKYPIKNRKLISCFYK